MIVLGHQLNPRLKARYLGSINGGWGSETLRTCSVLSKTDGTGSRVLNTAKYNGANVGENCGSI
jgi:hypothetical protein